MAARPRLECAEGGRERSVRLSVAEHGRRVGVKSGARKLVDTSFDPNFHLADFNASPFFSINTVDHHYANETAAPSVTESYTPNRFHSNFAKMSFGGCLEYRIWQGLSAGTSFYYTMIKSLTGEEYTSTTGSNYTDHSGFYAETSQSYWKASLYAKYTFRFGPTHTPKVRPAREKKSKAPKVRKGKVDVIQY